MWGTEYRKTPVILRYSRSTVNGSSFFHNHNRVYSLNSWWDLSWIREEGALYSELPKFFMKNTTRTHTNSITISTTVNIKIDTVYIKKIKIKKRLKIFQWL